MLVMLRHAVLLRPTTVSVTGGLAVAAMTAFVLSLVHDLDATVMILIWDLGSAALIAGLAGIFGRSSFRWVASRLTPRFFRVCRGSRRGITAEGSREIWPHEASRLKGFGAVPHRD